MFNNVESGFNHEGINNLDVVFQNVRNVLFTALSNGFLPTLAPVFGINADSSQFRSLVEDWAQGDFSQLPSIKILPSSSMNGANGGFSDKNRTIYLSSDYVSHASADRDPLTGLTGTLLEEIGHFVDSLVNPVSDTLGDEGELFAANLMGLSLSSQEQERIAQENDHSFFSVNGQIIPIEQSLPDLAGNTLATARVVTVGATATTFTDFVGNLDTDDYYKFTLASNSLLDLKLTGLTANAYIEILDGTGAWITGSYNDGIVDETIQRALTAGTYYIQVQPEVLADFSGWENTNYSLILVATA
ncbi:MAG: hypothetical protein GPI95_20950, partial [Microcystis aeruginosa LG13-11]|nr:hypothetical protein [Microcystis aeruginosa LG13-11]NCS79692.1 hypothetical protein [Microcystis aeruginosa K13-07]